jgi:hypothetical protein
MPVPKKRYYWLVYITRDTIVTGGGRRNRGIVINTRRTHRIMATERNLKEEWGKDYIDSVYKAIGAQILKASRLRLKPNEKWAVHCVSIPRAIDDFVDFNL